MSSYQRRDEVSALWPPMYVPSTHSSASAASSGPKQYTASDWASAYLVLNGSPFSLHEYPFQTSMYNQELGDEYSAMLWKTARQIGKSTTQSNDLIKDLCLRPFWKSLFITPSQEQTMRFVQTRFDAVLHSSPRLQGRWVTPDLASRVFLKQFGNGSECVFSYASTNADRIRGVSADAVRYDEVQDIEYDTVIPVVRQVLANSNHKHEHFSGTPKTMENTIEQLWASSSQTVWAVRCTGCGQFTILDSARCLGLKGPICVNRRCGKYLNVRHGIWVDSVAYPKDYLGKRIKGYHVSKLMLPANVPMSMANTPDAQRIALMRWRDILSEHATFPETQFDNEVLGISNSTGARMFTQDELVQWCAERAVICDAHALPACDAIVAGVDWSGGGSMGKSRTVLWIWGVDRPAGSPSLRLHTRFFKVYPDEHPITGGIVEDILRLCQLFGVQLVLGDAGGGALANSYLQAGLGARAQQVQYEKGETKQNGKPPLYWNKEDRFMASRTTMIDHYFAQLKNGRIRLAQAEQMRDTAGGYSVFSDMLSLYEETTKTGYRVWRKSAGVPDDATHAQVFGWIAANIVMNNATFARDVA